MRTFTPLRLAGILALCASLIGASNLSYQWFGPGDWLAAVERTWFSINALVMAWFALMMLGRKS